MPPSTTLQMVSTKELILLRKTPSGIRKLNKPHAESFSTFYFASINWFLLGEPAPAVEGNPVAAALVGYETIATPALDAGSFNVIGADQIADIANALEKVDLKKLRKDVESADKAALAKQKVDDFELVLANDSPAATIVTDVKQLTSFYRNAAAKHLGVVLYKT
ncbi:MAG TPA: DUF1877 family protein [Kofleriaceae bacterium]